MASIDDEVNNAMIKLKRVTADPDVGGQDISRMPIDILAGALIFVDNNLKKYTLDAVRQVLVTKKVGKSIAWGVVTEAGFTESQMFNKKGDPFPDIEDLHLEEDEDHESDV